MKALQAENIDNTLLTRIEAGYGYCGMKEKNWTVSTRNIGSEMYWNHPQKNGFWESGLIVWATEAANKVWVAQKSGGDFAPAYLFDDNFEDNDTSDWTVEAGITLTAQEASARSGTYGALANFTSAQVKAYKDMTESASAEITASYDVRPKQVNKNIYLILASGNSWRANIWFAEDGRLYWNRWAGNDELLSSYSADTWYTIGVRFNPLANSGTATVDGSGANNWYTGYQVGDTNNVDRFIIGSIVQAGFQADFDNIQVSYS
jgi:hypothetical protein